MKVPAALAPFLRGRRCCGWRLELTKSGKSQKTPYLDLRWKASTSKPHQWLPFEAADALAATFQGMGLTAGVGMLLGMMPGGHDRLICVDLDAARDPETGELLPWADEVLGRFASFTEISPSGRGLHVLLTTTDADLDVAGLLDAKRKAHNRSWKGSAPDGGKAPGVDLLVNGFVTVTGEALNQGPMRIERATVEALRWLAEELGPRIERKASAAREAQPQLVAAKAPTAAPIGHNGGPPLAPAPLPELIPQPVKSAVTRAVEPVFWVSPTRMARHAIALNPRAFQLLFALWAAAEKGHAGWARVVLPQSAMLQLHGSEADSRRGRSAISRAIRELERPDVGLLRLIQPCVLPSAAGPGRAAIRQVIAPFAHDSASGAPRPKLLSFTRRTQRRMLELHPRALRILAWLVATRSPEEAFRLSANDVARALGGKPEAAAPFIAELAAGGWLQTLEAPDGPTRRPGFYRLGSAFGG